MFTFATTATAVGTVAACSSSSAVALYGAPCTDADPCTVEDGGDGGGLINDGGGPQPLYGAAPHDAGTVEGD